MKRLFGIGLVVAMGMGLLAGCRSVTGIAAWQDATLLVLGEGTDKAQQMEGEALHQYLRTFSPDDRKVYRPVTGSRTGFLVLEGIRYAVTVAEDAKGNGQDLMTIHSGAHPLHLRQR